MKISLNWLADFIEFTENDPQKIADRITVSVAEVDDVEVQGALLKNCCVGKLVSLGKHPNADKLSLATVQTDRGPMHVVCGGTNLREGMYVAFAHIGATVKWNGKELQTLAPVKIRGEESEGMICAAEELDIDHLYPPKPDDGERPIVELHAKEKDAGASLREFMGMHDVILHVDNHAITNRPDLFSHVGFARECVALGLGTWKRGKELTSVIDHLQKKITFGSAALPFACTVTIPDLVPRYCACVLEMDTLGQTPDWMVKRLSATGWRSVSLPVDITNYVTMELGMPLHSFDADDLRGAIDIRLSKEGEEIITLDGVTRVLPKNAIVISDDLGIFDLLGIMGGLRSSTKETTRRIYLHSACVDPVSIRKAIIATGHRTDAGTIYEKGIPKMIVKPGLLRALELFLDLVPGCRIVTKLEEAGDDGTVEPVVLSPERVNSVLGTTIESKRMAEILRELGCDVDVKRGKDASLHVTPPLWRVSDLRNLQDLAEEIGRIQGYNDIPPVMPAGVLRLPDRDLQTPRIRASLKESRYMEIVPLSLTSAEQELRAGGDPHDAIALQNPIGEELKLLQTSTLPGLLEHASRAVRARDSRGKNTALKTFTCAHVFSKKHGEHAELGLLVCGGGENTESSDHLKEEPALIAKMDILQALNDLGFETECVPAKHLHPSMHPGRSLAVKVQGTEIGTVFEVHPLIQKAFDLPGRAAAAIINMQTLLELKPVTTIATHLPNFPAVSYDVTQTLTQEKSVGRILEPLRTMDPLLESIDVIDLYTGKPLKEEEYNLTLRFTYRAKDRTLTEAEAQGVHEKVIAKM